METLVFYMFPNPAYINQQNPFQVGWIDSNGVLTNVSNDVTINIITPTMGASIQAAYSFAPTTLNLLVTTSLAEVTVYLQITYEDNAPQYFSICLVQPIPQMTFNAIYRNFTSYLPLNVYTLSQKSESPFYVQSNAIATTLFQLYNNSTLTNLFESTQQPAFKDINTIISAIFPESGDSAWEQFLVGTNQLYNQTSTDYPALLTLLYQTNINNNTNPYFLAWNISQ
jgi:hypothetical protein